MAVSGSRPTAGQIAVALEALRDDADRWAKGGEDLRAAQAAIRAAAVDSEAFSGLGADMARAYAALHARIAGLVTDATTNYDAVAAALRRSADTYEKEERANVHRLRGIY